MKKCKCKLCEKYYSDSEMSEDHYPAKCVGNYDVVKFDITKALDMFTSREIINEIESRYDGNKSNEEIGEEIFDEILAKPLFPKGRTARTLCIECNRLLGKYDESYKKFYDANGDEKIVKGFTFNTKLNIIKSI